MGKFYCGGSLTSFEGSFGLRPQGESRYARGEHATHEGESRTVRLRGV